MNKLHFRGRSYATACDEYGTHDLPDGAASQLWIRYVLDGDVAIDGFPDKTDDEVLAAYEQHAKDLAAANEVKAKTDFYIKPDRYKQWLGRDRRKAIKALAAADDDVLDMQESLDFLDLIWSKHADFVDALDVLEAQSDTHAALANIKSDFYETGHLLAEK